MTEYSPRLADLRDRVDAELYRFLAERASALSEARPLIDETLRMVRLGGKRLRPAFCYWGHRAAGGRDGEPIARIGAALELLHTFALVHDDIMDQSPMRRGGPSTQAKYGNDFALLVGDLSLVLADEAFQGAGFTPEETARGFAAYSRMRQQVIEGQFLDFEVAQTGRISESAARRIAVLKSGLYSVVEPLTIGAALADGSSSLTEQLRAFGVPLGEAFQLRDDLLGTFGDPGATGKPADSDVREGKLNLLYVKATESLADAERDRFKHLWGSSGLSDANVEWLRSSIESCGARSDVEDLLDQLTATARSALASLEVDAEVQSALEDLLVATTVRSA